MGKLCYIVQYYWNTDERHSGIYMDIPIVEIINWINFSNKK